MNQQTIKLDVNGLDELRVSLTALPDKLRKKVLYQALTVGARLVQKKARASAPVLSLSVPGNLSALRRGIRKPGTLRKALSVRRSKTTAQRGDVGVFVNVRPLKNPGKNNPADPFYWRWVNWGWNPARGSDGIGSKGKRARRAINAQATPKRRPGVRFLESGAQALGVALPAITASLAPKIQALNRKGSVSS